MRTLRFNPAFDTAVYWVTAAVGAGLLAFGLRQWTAITWANEVVAARPPVPFGVAIELPPGTATLSLGVRWLIVARSKFPERICKRVLEDEKASGVRPTLAVLVVNEMGSQMSRCGEQGTVQSSAISSGLDTTLSRGFVVIGRDSRVVYGSYDLDYLQYVIRSLSLLDSTTTQTKS